MVKLETTSDCIAYAKELLKQAETKKEHTEIWEKKRLLMEQINDSLASGAFKGEALEELRTAKQILHTVESLLRGCL